jgi:hypothetical protein
MYGVCEWPLGARGERAITAYKYKLRHYPNFRPNASEVRGLPVLLVDLKNQGATDAPSRPTDRQTDRQTDTHAVRSIFVLVIIEVGRVIIVSLKTIKRIVLGLVGFFASS